MIAQAAWANVWITADQAPYVTNLLTCEWRTIQSLNISRTIQSHSNYSTSAFGTDTLIIIIIPDVLCTNFVFSNFLIKNDCIIKIFRCVKFQRVRALPLLLSIFCGFHKKFSLCSLFLITNVQKKIFEFINNMNSIAFEIMKNK